MRTREKITAILDRKNTGSVGFWGGNYHPETIEKIKKEMPEINSYQDFWLYTDDDCRYMGADGSYKHPEGKPMFYTAGSEEERAKGAVSYFASLTDDDLDKVAKFDWPSLDYLDFTEVIGCVEACNDKGVFTGFWSPFFHLVSDYFGMEDYFVKMYTDPKLVEAVTDSVVDFLVEANDRYFTALGDRADILFIGNDLGTQREMFMSPECFDRFILPSIKKFADVAHKHGKRLLMHSCGSIYKIIPRLIDAGVDGLNPLQALAANMDCVTLGREFKNDIAFVGGIDTQQLLTFGTPEQVRDEVFRVREHLGENLIISPSHECILPNVPKENIIAMAKAAKEI